MRIRTRVLFVLCATLCACAVPAVLGEHTHGPATTIAPRPTVTTGAVVVVQPLPARRATAIVVADQHACALLDDATVKCWGRNEVGQLGDGTKVASPRPVAAKGLTDVVQLVAGGDDFGCARRRDGTVSCWGYNGHGQLGDGTRIDRATPVTVRGLAGTVDVACGGVHCCAALTEGTVRCWGLNAEGQLGHGREIDSTLARSVAGIADAVDVGLGTLHSCARLRDGRVVCWGAEDAGSLGDGGHANRPEPKPAIGIKDAVQLEVRYSTSCVRHSDGSVSCWGVDRDRCRETGSFLIDNKAGIFQSVAIARVLPGVTGATSIAVGFEFCVRRGSDSYACRSNVFREQSCPRMQSFVVDDAVAFDSSGSWRCAVGSRGEVRCSIDGAPMTPVVL